MNYVAVNMGVQISFQVSVFIFSGYVPRSEIAGSCGSSIFNSLRVFQGEFFLWEETVSGGHARYHMTLVPGCSSLFQRWVPAPKAADSQAIQSPIPSAGSKR